MDWGGCVWWCRRRRGWCLPLWRPARLEKEEEEQQQQQQEQEQEQQVQEQEQQYHKQTIGRGEEGRGMVPIDKKWMMMKGLKQ